MMRRRKKLRGKPIKKILPVCNNPHTLYISARVYIKLCYKLRIKNKMSTGTPTSSAAVADTPSNSPLQPVITAAARIKDVSLHVFSQRKPMSEILDRTAYSKPASFSDATSRMQKNLNYFKINYMIATMGILSAFILYHPSSLLILSAISAAWAYVFMIRQEPLKIGEREVSSREKMLGMTGLSALIIFFLSSAGTYIFSGMGVALLGIGAHSAARVPDDLFIDDASESNGFFSFMMPPRPGQPSGTI